MKAVQPTSEQLDQIRRLGRPVSRLPDDFPPNTCVRPNDAPTEHLKVMGYGETVKQKAVLLLVHGADSVYPGIRISIEDPTPQNITICNCGGFKHVSEEEGDLNNELLRAHGAAGHRVPEST